MQRWQDGDNGDDGGFPTPDTVKFSVTPPGGQLRYLKMLIGPRFGDYVTARRRISRIVPGPMKYFSAGFSKVEDARQEVQTV